MKYDLKSVCLAACLTLLFSCSDQAQQNSDQSNSRALTLVDNYSESFSANWASKNAEAMGNLYAEDAVRIVSTRQTPEYGREAITAQFEEDFGGNFDTTEIQATTSKAKFLSSEIVVATGTYSVTDNAGRVINQGLWGNAFKLEGDTLTMLMESAGASTPDGMRQASLSTPEVTDQPYEGPGANLVNDGVSAYVLNTNTGNFSGVADLFMPEGIQAVSNNNRIIFGRDDILEAINQNAVAGIELDAWSYGYRDLGNSIAIGWGGYRQLDDSGALIGYGLWGNIWEITTDGLKLVIERAGAFSGE
ncbi:MAG: DUF4440 domain-containing protein [Arenicellales bacterium]|nr:DUF4440 domain-containing protein [Arenicellales bacterium]